jgi:hypothetical protein
LFIGNRYRRCARLVWRNGEEKSAGEIQCRDAPDGRGRETAGGQAGCRFGGERHGRESRGRFGVMMDAVTKRHLFHIIANEPSPDTHQPQRRLNRARLRRCSCTRAISKKVLRRDSTFSCPLDNWEPGNHESHFDTRIRCTPTRRGSAITTLAVIIVMNGSITEPSIFGYGIGTGSVQSSFEASVNSMLSQLTIINGNITANSTTSAGIGMDRRTRRSKA